MKLDPNTLLMATTWLWKGSDLTLLSKAGGQWKFEAARWNPFSAMVVPIGIEEYKHFFDGVSGQVRLLQPEAKSNLGFRLSSINAPASLVGPIRSAWGPVSGCAIESAPEQTLSRADCSYANTILGGMTVGQTMRRTHGSNHFMTITKISDRQFLMVTTWTSGMERDGDAVLFNKTDSGFVMRAAKPERDKNVEHHRGTF